MSELTMTKSDLEKFIAEETEKAVAKRMAEQADHLDGIAQDLGGEEAKERQKEGRERAFAKFEGLTTGEQHRAIDQQVGQWERNAKSFANAVRSGDIPSTAAHRLRQPTNLQALPWAREGDDLGRGNHVTAAVMLAGRAFVEGRSVDSLIAELDQRGELMGREVASVLKRAQKAGDFASGGAFIEEVFSADYIPALYARSIVLASGVVTVDMSTGNLTIPKQTGTTTGYWVGEGGAITKSELTGGRVRLSAKKVAALTPMSNDFLRQTKGLGSALVRNDLLTVAALTRDLAYLRGVGSANEPEGLLSQRGHTVTTAGNTHANKISDLMAAEYKVHNSDVTPVRPCWYMSVREEFGLKQTLNADGGWAFLVEMMNGTLLGKPFYSTTQIPNNLDTSGTSDDDESDIYYVETSHVVVGQTMDIEFKVFDGGAYNDGSGQVNGIQVDESVARVIAETDIKARNGEAIAVIRETTYGASFDA